MNTTTEKPVGHTPRTNAVINALRNERGVYDELERMTALARELERENTELRGNAIVLNAWQHAFGTTQLSHAIARLEAAEQAAKHQAVNAHAELVEALKAVDAALKGQMNYEHQCLTEDTSETCVTPAKIVREALAKLTTT